MTYRIRNISLAVMLALVAALLTTFYVSNYKRNVQRGEGRVTVLVAAKDIAAGTAGSDLVKRDVLVPRDVPRRTVVPGAISSGTQIQKLVATQPIYAGEQVTARRFSPLAARGVRSQLKGNLRAVQIAGDPNQVLAGTLKGGDRIDLIASVKYKVSDVVGAGTSLPGDVDRVASRVVLRDIRVLKASSGASAGAKLTSGPTGAYSVQLAVTDSQAQKLFFVVKNADWSLQLRPLVDAADSPESVETIESVLGDGLRSRQFRQLYAGKENR